MLWALLQFALPTAATYADAMLERAGGADVVAHIEADGTAGCPAVHPADCAICHLVHRLATPGAPEGPAVYSSSALLRPETSAGAFESAERGRLPLARAPPVV